MPSLGRIRRPHGGARRRHIDSAGEDPARALQSLVRAKAILATATNTGAMQAIAGGLGVNGTMVIGVVGSLT